ncbi:N-acetyltransferase [Olsenella sp. TM06-36]|nr:N-acetyltransferase [Olsenella sp. TM06-36]
MPARRGQAVCRLTSSLPHASRTPKSLWEWFLLRRPTARANWATRSIPAGGGRSIATEMCQAVVDLACTLGLGRLTATVDVRNTASERVLAHVGMKPRRPAKDTWQDGEKSGCRLWELELEP